MTQEAAETKPAATKATAKKTPRPKALTLQQKFIKLREAIPAIVKAKHSEGVEYKFAKISDVYRLLTPAMNEHGVNFDIVAEHCHTEVTKTLAHLHAVTGTPAIRRQLGLRPDQALMQLEETCYSRLCQPVLCCQTCYTDFFNFAIVRKLL